MRALVVFLLMSMLLLSAPFAAQACPDSYTECGATCCPK